MKALIALITIFIIGSAFAEESCDLIERLKSDTEYLESKKAYIKDLYKENTTTTGQLVGAGSLYSAGAAYALSRKYSLMSTDYLSKVAVNEILAHPNLIAKSNYKYLSKESRLLLITKANKSLLKSKVGAFAGIALGGIGVVFLLKDYQEQKGNYIVKPYLITEIKNKEALINICNELEVNPELKASVMELAKKLFITRAKVEEIVASNGNAKLNDSDRKEIKETMKVVNRNIKNNRVNQ